MKKSFNAEDREAQEAAVAGEVISEELALVEGLDEPTSLASLNLGIDTVSGPISRSDIIIPSVKIVQSVGPLSVTFPEGGGKVVLNGELVIVEKEEPLELTVLGIAKQYVEALPYDPKSAVKARTWTSHEQMVADGFWADWRDNKRPPAKELATMIWLIKKPDALDSPQFHLEGPDGGRYVMAKFIAQGTAYTRGAKKVFTALATSLSETGLSSGKWRMFTHRVKAGDNFVYAPNMTEIGLHTDEFRGFIRTLMGR